MVGTDGAATFRPASATSSKGAEAELSIQGIGSPPSESYSCTRAVFGRRWLWLWFIAVHQFVDGQNHKETHHEGNVWYGVGLYCQPACYRVCPCQIEDR